MNPMVLKQLRQNWSPKPAPGPKSMPVLAKIGADRMVRKPNSGPPRPASRRNDPIGRLEQLQRAHSRRGRLPRGARPQPGATSGALPGDRSGAVSPRYRRYLKKWSAGDSPAPEDAFLDLLQARLAQMQQAVRGALRSEKGDAADRPAAGTPGRATGGTR